MNRSTGLERAGSMRLFLLIRRVFKGWPPLVVFFRRDSGQEEDRLSPQAAALRKIRGLVLFGCASFRGLAGSTVEVVGSPLQPVVQRLIVLYADRSIY